MAHAPDDQLDQARTAAGLSQSQLWLRYFGLGGMVPALELEAVLLGALKTDDEDRDRIVHALNERFSEQGRNHPVPYSDDVPRAEDGVGEVEGD
ncbi:MAG TPA: hypothetical protein VNA14_07420 [Mycobacteriales bacterium]|nr:hypothetical protein [Mycobacteriales bacterium]